MKYILNYCLSLICSIALMFNVVSANFFVVNDEDVVMPLDVDIVAHIKEDVEKVIHGKITTIPRENNKKGEKQYDVIINWFKLKHDDMSVNVDFQSNFQLTGNIIKEKAPIEVIGNVDGLINDMDNEEEREADKKSVSEETNNNTPDVNIDSSLGGGGGSNESTFNPDDLTPEGGLHDTQEVVTAIDDCELTYNPETEIIGVFMKDFYFDGKGNKVVKRNCYKAKSVPAKYNECDVLNDYVKRQSYAQRMAVYIEPETTEEYSASPCLNYATYSHTFDSIEADCPAFTENDMYIKRGRWFYITPNGTKHYVTDCVLDPSDSENSLDIEYKNCDRTDDINQNVSTWLGRYYYTMNNERHYVGQCANLGAKSTFPHHIGVKGYEDDIENDVTYEVWRRFIIVLNEDVELNGHDVHHEPKYHHKFEVEAWDNDIEARYSRATVTRYVMLPSLNSNLEPNQKIQTMERKVIAEGEIDPTYYTHQYITHGELDNHIDTHDDDKSYSTRKVEIYVDFNGDKVVVSPCEDSDLDQCVSDGEYYHRFEFKSWTHHNADSPDGYSIAKEERYIEASEEGKTKHFTIDTKEHGAKIAHDYNQAKGEDAWEHHDKRGKGIKFTMDLEQGPSDVEWTHEFLYCGGCGWKNDTYSAYTAHFNDRLTYAGNISTETAGYSYPNIIESVNLPDEGRKELRTYTDTNDKQLHRLDENRVTNNFLELGEMSGENKYLIALVSDELDTSDGKNISKYNTTIEDDSDINLTSRLLDQDNYYHADYYHSFGDNGPEVNYPYRGQYRGTFGKSYYYWSSKTTENEPNEDLFAPDKPLEYEYNNIVWRFEHALIDGLGAFHRGSTCAGYGDNPDPGGHYKRYCKNNTSAGVWTDLPWIYAYKIIEASYKISVDYYIYKAIRPDGSTYNAGVHYLEFNKSNSEWDTPDGHHNLHWGGDHDAHKYWYGEKIDTKSLNKQIQNINKKHKFKPTKKKGKEDNAS